jgi:anti-sigma factor RsiW
MDMQETHVDDLIDAYALGALEPGEVAFVERHLEGCASCQALLEQARGVTGNFLLAVPQLVPPPALRGRLLDRIRAEKAARTPAEYAPPPVAAGTEPAALTAPRETGFDRLLRLMFGGETPADEAAGTLLRDLMLDPDVVIVPVAGTEAAARAGGRLVASRSRREGVLLAHGLRPLDASHSYQVWLLRGGRPLPNALFSVNRAGRGAGIVRHAEPLLNFDVVAVTPEPSGGSPSPTGPIVLAGPLGETAAG